MIEYTELKQIIEKSKSKQELAYALGYSYYNGRVLKELTKLLKKHSLDFPVYNRCKSKYEIITKYCPVCNTSFETKLNHRYEKTVCSYKCSNIYFGYKRYTINSRLNKSKLEKVVINNNFFYVKTCENCFTIFNSKYVKKKFCSKQCIPKPLFSKETRLKLSLAQKKRIENGTHTGWISRDKCNRSWAELYVERNILTKFGLIKDIDYKTEYRVGKWFIDFAFLNEKIAIEIDGKQHNLLDRKLKDIKKDNFLEAEGWTVYRIKWKKISAKTEIELLNTIQNILKNKVPCVY